MNVNYHETMVLVSFIREKQSMPTQWTLSPLAFLSTIMHQSVKLSLLPNSSAFQYMTDIDLYTINRAI